MKVLIYVMKIMLFCCFELIFFTLSNRTFAELTNKERNISAKVLVNDNSKNNRATNIMKEYIAKSGEYIMSKCSTFKVSQDLGIIGTYVTARSISLQTATMPYDKSTFITGCTIDSTVISFPSNVARSGDNWPITWSADDNLYSFLADGYGFSPLSQQYSRYPCKITGSPFSNNVKGYDILTNSDGKGSGGDVKGKKVSGLISIPDPSDSSVTILVAWVRNINANGGASLLYSRDYGVNWTWAWGDPDSTLSSIIPELGHPSWMQAGKNNIAAQDKYLYFYSQNQPKAYLLAGDVILGRVPMNSVLDKSKYQYFNGTAENPAWSPGIDSRKPVFIAERQCYRLFVSFNPALNRYLLLTANGDGLMTNYGGTHNLGIYESKNPWGPWKTVYWNNSFHEKWNVFGPQIVPKWISSDGKIFYLLYSNFPKGPYKCNLQKITLTLSDK
jgi:hypothetical protein